MKFRKIIPTKSGWYWFINNNYISPMLGYYQNSIKKLLCLNQEFDLSEDIGYIRFGEYITLPDLASIVIENE